MTILGLLSLFIIFSFSIVFAINFGISTGAPSADLRDDPRDEAADAGCYECQSRQHSELTITTQSLPEGTVGSEYSATLTASGDATLYTWSISSGILPHDLSLNFSTGVISGTPTQAGNYNFTIKVTDSSNPPNEVTKEFTLVIKEQDNPPGGITTVVSKIKPDCTGESGLCFTSLAAWEEARQGDITASGRNSIEVAECYPMVDATPVVIDGQNRIGTWDIEADTVIPSEGPVLHVDFLSFDFGTEITEKTFNITNTGTGILNWTITKDKDGIFINPISGETTTETDTITVTVNREGLDIGVYNGIINVTSNGGSANISVRIEVADADADGLPDNWERQIIDDNPNDDIVSIEDVNPRDDYDRDGYTNQQECMGRTNPIAPEDYPGHHVSGSKAIKVICDRWPDTSSLKNFGESAAKLMGAQSNEEKAIALWRFIQQCTETKGGRIIAREPAYGINYMLDPIKLLNVYGVHYCDGLSRIMEMTWRSMGYRAEKYYKWGHTLADIWYEDENEIERWHLFDVSQHWFVYNRAGGHIATPEEIIGDYSLISRPSATPIPSWGSGYGHWGYVHAHHLKWPTHDMLLNLRPGESFTRLWGNEGLPYYDVFANMGGTDFEHGPYELTYGNGKLIYTPDFSKSSYKNGLYEEPQNLSSIEEDGQSPNLHPATPGNLGIAIFKISTPYIISDAWVSGTLVRKNSSDDIAFYISVDGGETWRQVYQASQTGTFTLDNFNIAEKFNVTGSYPSGLITPFGHYEYLFKIELKASNNISDCGIENLTITTITQHNIFSLPQLWPGKNTITVTGDIGLDTSLRITYVWDDLMGQERKNVAVVEDTPYSYEIITAGNKWEDVVCKSITIEAIPGTGNGNFIEVKEEAPDVLNNITPPDAFPTIKIIGSSYPTPLKTVVEYITDLNNAISAQEGYETDDPKVWGQASNVQNALWGLSEYGSVAYSAKDAVINAIKKDRSHRYNKAYACQTLYTIAGSDAVPTLKLVLRRDPSILWAEDSSLETSANLWLHTCAAAASILAQIDSSSAKEAADDIEKLLNETWVQNKCNYNPNNVYRWSELRWAFVKALGKLGNSSHGTSLRNIITDLTANGDEKALAARALGEIGDKSAVAELLNLLKTHDYSPQGLYSIESLGKLGDPSIAPELYSYLNHWDEDYRGFTAKALGNLGNKDAIPYLQALLKNESFEWVRKAAQESLSLLEGSQPLSITTESPLSDAIVGIEYSATLSASGGTSPYTWSITSGNLPSGLSLTNTSEISGTSTTVGTSTFTINSSLPVGRQECF